MVDPRIHGTAEAMELIEQLRADNARLREMFILAVDGLKRGCSCRPGGGQCNSCRALAQIHAMEKEIK